MSENQIALKNLVSMETLTNEEVMALIKRGIEFKNGAKAAYEDQHIISNLFFEPSTRTHKAFEVAELKLGCEQRGNTLRYHLDHVSSWSRCLRHPSP